MSAKVVRLKPPKIEPSGGNASAFNHDGWIIPFPVTYFDKLYRAWDMSDTPFTMPEGLE